MKRYFSLSAVFALTLTSIAYAQEMPEMPKPVQEHEFLHKFVGDWVSEMEASGIPGQPPMKSKGESKAKMMGGFWVVVAGKGEMGGEPMESIMQLGYDAKKKKYVGTWSDSCSGHMWHYEGTLEGNTLTLNTEGPNMQDPEKTSKYRDQFTFISPAHYELSSSMENGEGGWTTFLIADFKKK
jgi:hypothetical protein